MLMDLYFVDGIEHGFHALSKLQDIPVIVINGKFTHTPLKGFQRVAYRYPGVYTFPPVVYVIGGKIKAAGKLWFIESDMFIWS